MPQGYVIHEDRYRVVIVTGFEEPSSNTKTGPMLQVWILVRHVSPYRAAELGQDRLVCGNCPHAGKKRISRQQGKRIVTVIRKRSCYVALRAPQAIWNAYRRGSYPHLKLENYGKVFARYKVRLGAYGDPCYIPEFKVRAMCSAALGRTGYTHQWSNSKHAWLKEFVMASIDRTGDLERAHADGWRTFRVGLPNAEPLENEILCPASKQAGQRTNCFFCLTCDGAGPRRSIFTPIHGSQANNGLSILQ